MKKTHEIRDSRSIALNRSSFRLIEGETRGERIGDLALTSIAPLGFLRQVRARDFARDSPNAS